MNEKQTRAAELIARLRFCAGDENFEVCSGCPYESEKNCIGRMMLDAADALAALLEDGE